jgi:hypothetical protein
MEPTPTGGSARPSTDGGVRDHAEVEGLRTAEASTGASTRSAPCPTEDAADQASALPAPRSDLPVLPRRRRTAEPTGYAESVSRKPAGHDPDGRPYHAPDQETLNRLLSGLRDI